MEQQMNSAFSSAHGEGKAFWFNGTLMELKATGEETNGAFSLFEALQPSGYATPMHIYRNEEEIFYVLEGEFTFTVGEKTIAAKPGSFLFAPRDIQHMYKVEGQMPARMLIMLLPAGGEKFFIEAGVEAEEFKLPSDDVVPDFNKMVAAAQKYRIEVIE